MKRKLTILASAFILLLSSCVLIDEKTLSEVTISDNVSSYSIGSIYSEDNGLDVIGTYENGTKKIKHGYIINGEGFDPKAPFEVAGTYSLSVSYKQFVSNTINIVVDEDVSSVDPTNISLTQSLLSLSIGSKETLTYNLSPSNAHSTVLWKSSSPTVASVNNGLVTALAVGTSNITVTTVNGLSSTCLVSVDDGTSPDTYRIQFDTSGTLDSNKVLNTSELLAQVVSGQQYISSFSSVSYVYSGNGGLKLGSSQNPGSFTIDLSSEGKVQAREIVVSVKKFKTDTTTMSINELSSQSIVNDDYTELKYTIANNTKTLETIELTTSGKRCYISYIDIRFKEPDPVAMTSFKLDSSNLVVPLGDNATLTANIAPTNVYPFPTITWSSDKPSIANVNNGTVNGISEGTANITATAIQGTITLSATCAVTVSKIAVTGVTLDYTSTTIFIHKTVELIATISPTNSSNKAVSWSSDNSAIATVNNGVVTGVSFGTAKITATTSDGGFAATCDVIVEESPNSAWTFMVYMCGSDLESDSQYRLATGDLQEIQNVTGQPDNVNVIVQAGGANSWSSKYSSVINASKLNRFHIENGTYVKDVQLPRANMGLSSTFQSFMEWGLEEYPAERTMVIFWNHGGAMQGNCFDEFHNDGLLNSEVDTALAAAFKSTGRTQKLEAVGYDVCLAQVQDIAEFNSNYFNYMIASQESEAGYGWDYDGGWLDLIYKNPTTVQTSTVLTSIVDTFIDDNGGVNYSKNDQTLSWLDLSKMAAYKTAWENMANYLNTNILTSSNKAAFQTLIAGCKHFADDDYTYFGTFDAKDFLTKLSANSTFNKLSLSSYISAAQSALSDLIGYSSCGKAAGNANGLCMFFSISSNCYKSTYYKASETNFINWRQINNSFGA